MPKLKELVTFAADAYKKSSGDKQTIADLTEISDEKLPDQILATQVLLNNTKSTLGRKLIAILASLVQVQQKKITTKIALQTIEQIIKEQEKLYPYTDTFSVSRYKSDFQTAFKKFTDETTAEIQTLKVDNIKEESKSVQHDYSDFSEIEPVIMLSIENAKLSQHYDVLMKIVNENSHTTEFAKQIKKYQSTIETMFKKYSNVESKESDAEQADLKKIQELKVAIQNIKSPVYYSRLRLTVFPTQDFEKRMTGLDFCNAIIKKINSPITLTENQLNYLNKNKEKLAAHAENRASDLSHLSPTSCKTAFAF